MSALAVKARKLADAHEKAKGRAEFLATEAVALTESFGDDPADVSKVLAARAAVETAKSERDVLASALEAAQKAHAQALAEEAKRQAEKRHARLLAEAGGIKAELLAALVNVARLAGRNASLCDSLGNDRFRFWLSDIAGEASKAACANVVPRKTVFDGPRGPVEIVTHSGTRSLSIALEVPLMPVE